MLFRCPAFAYPEPCAWARCVILQTPTKNGDESRPLILFGLDGVNDREALLLKSMIRLLDYRSSHQWVYSAGKHDVVFVAHESVSAANCSAVALFPMVLMIGQPANPDIPFLQRPISSENLEAILFRLAVKLLAAKNKLKLTDSTVASISPPHQAHYKLKRWPPAQLIASKERLRLAALIAASEMNLDGMQKRSGAGVEVCKAFIADLARAGLLETRSVPMSTNSSSTMFVGASNAPIDSKKSEKIGFLARMRQRLAQQIFTK